MEMSWKKLSQGCRNPDGRKSSINNKTKESFTELLSYLYNVKHGRYYHSNLSSCFVAKTKKGHILLTRFHSF